MKFNTHSYRLAIATVAVGVVAGAGGVFLVWLLHTVQHLAYGYSLHEILSTTSFLQGASAAAPIRRLIAMIGCGLLAGFGWWALYRYGQGIVGIAQAMQAKIPRMPWLTTILHACLQVTTIALGSPLGREVAPREVGAASAVWIARKLRLTPAETRLLLACGAGAGLAAVYNIPLSGALFTLEVLLVTWQWRALAFALITSVFATWIAWLGLGNHTQYYILPQPLSLKLLIWAVLMSPVCGLCAYYFRYFTDKARQAAPRGGRVIGYCVLNFISVGVIAMIFPAVLGNGKGPVQLAFDEQIGIIAALIWLVLRIAVVWSSLRAGAWGGLLTPSLANGVLLGIVLGGIWNHWLPPLPIAAVAVIGAAAFLATSQRMPLTAIVLIFEFTGTTFSLLLPVMLAVGGAILTSRYLGDDH